MSSQENEIQNKELELYSSKINPSTHNPSNKNSLSIDSSNPLDSTQDIVSDQEHQVLNQSGKAINTNSSLELVENAEVLQDDVEYYEIPKSQTKRNKYGNMIIFLQSKHFLLSLGPNYIFFLFAYLCFTIATIFLVGLVNSNIENQTFKIVNFCFCWLQNLSYLLVALSNPGVVLPKSAITLESHQLKTKRFCTKCAAIQQRKTYHCRQCDVCVKDYDHHCPWTSKCIGGGNLKRFYFFVIMTPFYIFYYMIVFMICMANNVVEKNHSAGLRKEVMKLF